MANIYFVPGWFFGYDIIFELAFAIITLIVSLYAFNIYKLSNQRQSKLFGVGFLFISLSYFIQSFLNYMIVTKLNENICTALKIIDVIFLNNMATYSYVIFFTIGLITLTYMTLKIQSRTNYSLLLILITLSLFFSSNTLRLFHLISSILFIYVFFYYLVNYLKKKHTKTLLILFAFGFLLFGNVHFMISVDYEVYYVIGHLLELVAYSLILINLILVMKNAPKKR